MEDHLIKGRGAQFNTVNPFLKQQYIAEDSHQPTVSPQTQFFLETPKNIVSKSESPDLGIMHSINPYQGCEHGCIYCYARNSHNYWGLGAGLDFESKIMVKPNAPAMLVSYLNRHKGAVTPILLSGNTDCYQPAEKKFQLTRKLLQVFLDYRYPVSIITKNRLILRDLDILQKLAAQGLVNVFLSITTLDESIRTRMEPRTAAAAKRLDVIEILSANGIPVGIMNAPIVPGLTDHETPSILRETAARGALTAGYTIVRLNGTIGLLFEDWIKKTFPDRANKVLNQISDCHQGSLNDSQWYRRQKGSGNIADAIAQMFKTAFKKHYGTRKMPAHNKTAFRRGSNYLLDL